MRNRKIISLLALCLLSLASCGPQSSVKEIKEDGSNREYDLLVWEDKNKLVGIEDAVKKFEDKNNVRVKVVEKSYAENINDLRLDGPAGTGADVILLPGDQIGSAVTEGLLKEVEVSDNIAKKYSDIAIRAVELNGKYYGLPQTVETLILFYNKSIIAESELPKTTDQWLEYSKKRVSDSKDQYGLLALWDQIYYASGVIQPYGGYIFGENSNGGFNSKDIGLDNKGTIDAVKYIQKFYSEGAFPTGIIGENGVNNVDAMFTEGKAAAVISGPWNIEPYKEAGIDYGVIDLPLLPNGEHMSSFVGVKMYGISSYTKNSKLAEEFIEFITNEENSKKRYETTGEIPAISALNSELESTDNESSKAIFKQTEYGVLIPGITEMNFVWKPVDDGLQTVATGKAQPAKVLESAVEQIKSEIEASGK